MLRTYKGRYENGKFILPEFENGLMFSNVNIIVTVLDEEQDQEEKTNLLEKIFIEAQEAETDLTDEEWTEFKNLRSKTNLSRGIEKWFTH